MGSRGNYTIITEGTHQRNGAVWHSSTATQRRDLWSKRMNFRFLQRTWQEPHCSVWSQNSLFCKVVRTPPSKLFRDWKIGYHGCYKSTFSLEQKMFTIASFSVAKTANILNVHQRVVLKQTDVALLSSAHLAMSGEMVLFVTMGKWNA